MKIFGINFKREKQTVRVKQDRPYPSAYNNVISMSFDGEKNLGEMGPIKKYNVDYEALRLRSWQLFIDSPICQLVFNRYATWMIGSGLRLQSDPMLSVLKSEGINLTKDFNATVEDRFKLFSGSKISDYAGNETLNDIAWKVFINAIVGGDVLVIQRVINGINRVQLIDGCQVSSPYNLSFDLGNYRAENGNRIKHGVELDSKGKHVAYYVQTDYGKWERIEAYNNGHEVATLVYGLEYRIGEVRGMPLISAVMETASKVDQYQEATLSSAKNAAQIMHSIEHDHTSTGETPFIENMALINGFNKPGDNPITIDGKELENKVRAVTNNQSINMPIGSKLVPHESKKELYFNDFFTINIHLVCSTIGIPPEVALMKYDSNFSASRAALKDWEHTLLVMRAKRTFGFYSMVYHLWLTLEILKGKVVAPKYLKSLKDNDEMTLAAYRNARFTGANVPHIDPLKEVNAERAKLGKGADHMPLTTLEKATEVLNGGDAHANMIDYSREMEEAERLKIEKIQSAYNRSRGNNTDTENA